jgi:tetratricopeptide (TPR) repeat protein
MLALGVAAGLAAQAAAQTDPFYQGLKQRGLDKLAGEYLKQRGEEPPPTPVPVEPIGPVEPGKAEAAAKAELERARKATAQQREVFFERALALYRQAIADAKRAYEQTPESEWQARQEARMDTIRLRQDLGQMIFVDEGNWLEPHLHVLEVSDRAAGNRNRAAELLGIALEAFEGALQEAAQWQSEIDRAPDRRRFVNAGYVGKLRNLRRRVDFYAGWVTFFRGWALPEDYQPEAGKRSRDELLNDAITRLIQFTDLTDTAPNKYVAHLIIGQAQRELGRTRGNEFYEKALTSFAQADRAPENVTAPQAKTQAENTRIQAVYEKALTRLYQGRYADVRDEIKGIRGLYGAKRIDQTLYGLAMKIVEARSYIREGETRGAVDLKQTGLDQLKTLMESGDPWPRIVEAVLVQEGISSADEPEKMEPFQLWYAAGAAFTKAQESGAVEDFRKARKLFETYTEKVPSSDENYATALHAQASIFFELADKAETPEEAAELKNKAAELFRRVADEYPKYADAPNAARAYVYVYSQRFENASTEENRAEYEEALRWFNRNWEKADPDHQYNLGVVLYRGGEFREASKAFEGVPESSELYANARYWVALCELERFRTTALPTEQTMVILPAARAVVKELMSFANWALKADLPPEQKQEARGWAEGAYANAASIYVDPAVNLPKDALEILDEMEQNLTLGEDMRGRVLKLRIDAHVRMGRPEKAQALLEDFLAVMQRTGREDEIGPVLTGMFQATVEDVRKLVRRDAEAAAQRVDGAVGLSRMLTDWLQKNGGPERNVQIESIRYDIAELYLAVKEYNKAIDVYKTIAGTEKPWDVGDDEPLRLDCVIGMGEAYEGLGETAPDAGTARKHYEVAVEIWRVVLDAVGGRRDTSDETIWQMRYHLYYCKYRLGQTDDVRKALQSLRVITPPLGGKDIDMRIKFKDLAERVGLPEEGQAE